MATNRGARKANLLRLPRFRIGTWDAGWWQVRSALTEAGLAATELAVVKRCHDQLKEKLLPQVAALGFLG